MSDLDLSGNQLTALPPEIDHLSNLTQLDLKANQLPIPPEILEKKDDPDILINYYLQYSTGQKRPLNEVKMLLVGQGKVGKTSLVKRLLDGSFDLHEGKTEGINITQWNVGVDGQDVQLNVWDFGGQEIMHATHQFFLTKRSLYVLVLDARLGEDENRIEYWLKIIQSFGADSPVIIVGNQIDEHPLDINRAGLQDKYPTIKAFVETSCLTGQGIDDLLDKVLLEADLMELKGNADRWAQGVIIESYLDKGRGNVATVLVQNGTLRVGDSFVAGIYSGRVRAMFDERDRRIDEVGPSEPVLVLGFGGSPNVGDQFVVLEDESEARDIAQRRQQIYREQKMRQYKHVRLIDIGRRMALGDFSELNLIIKADVGGSVEALSDSLLKISNEEVAVNIIHSGAGAINESDVMLASASDAVIIGFQVRPTAGARAAAEREEIDIRTYSIIYDAIEDVRDALEGLLTPEESEKITGVAEVRELFKVPKMGTIAGSYVTEGRIRRNDTVHLLREGVVVYDSKIGSL
ncbi:MAG: GTP-binding protein, partial [Bacteroidetes bacterium]|nr:GTP-binding protein [Bacteroidota bacterium]